MFRRRVLLAIVLPSLLCGCAAPTHPGFPVSEADARRERIRMEDAPVPLERPLVVLGGYRMPFVGPSLMAGRITRMTSGRREDALAVHYFFAGSIERAAAIAARAVESRWPSDDPERTVEIDVVGISMGGLVARFAADAEPDALPEGVKRLQIVRLFTIATPHRGADMAALLSPDRAARQMQPDSPFLAALDERRSVDGYELVCYARTRDAMVGARRSSPPGEDPHWVHGPLLLSHLTATQDWRILVDIAGRLRGEPPLAQQASTPPRN